jgi:cell division protease FtsH
LKNFGRSAGTYLIIFIVVLSMSMMFRNFAQNSDIKEVKFSQFAQHLEKGDFESVNITERKLTGTKKDGTREVTYAPSLVEISWLEEKTLNPMIEEGKVELDSEPPKSEYTLLNILPTLLMVVAMGFLFYFMMSQGGNKQAFQFGKNRARLYKSDAKSITFKD